MMDIEELADYGKQHHQCPYYGARDAIASSELIILPYNLLLQKNARESLGIDLKGKIVIFGKFFLKVFFWYL